MVQLIQIRKNVLRAELEPHSMLLGHLWGKQKRSIKMEIVWYVCFLVCVPCPLDDWMMIGMSAGYVEFRVTHTST